MALVKGGQSTRVEIPHEPGSWMAFQRLSVRQLSERPDLDTTGWAEVGEPARIALALRWVQACVVAWSYDEPCTAEACERLDPRTTVWAYVTAVERTYRGETADEKNGGSGPSIGTSTASPAPAVPTPGS